MKKTIAITSALAAVTSLATAEIKINDFLSFEGFVDMSYSHTDRDSGGSNSNDNSFGIDEVEIDWLFNFGKVTARVDLEYGYVQTDDQGTLVEQAFVNYDLGNGASITAGRYESMLGLEAKEPTGLYQYSTAYGSGINANFIGLPDYAQGVKYFVQNENSSYGISIQDTVSTIDNAVWGYNGAGSLGGPGNGNGDDGTFGVEAAASLTSGAFTYFVGAAYEDRDGGDASNTFGGGDLGDFYVINAHVTYVDGPWTIGAELIVSEQEQVGGDDVEGLGGLIMANYAYSDCCSITGRVSYHEEEEGSFEGEFTKYTVAHNYAVTDNLAIITEVSLADYEDNGSTDDDELVGAVEVLFSF